MVHTVIVDNKVEAVLKGLLSSGGITIGILVGQVTKTKDYVLLAVQTPSLQELKENEDEKSSNSSEHFEDWWVIEHAKQVINLLPGGLGVVGMFCVCSKEVLPSIQPRVAGILPQLTPHPHTIFLHVCSLSGKTKGLVLHEQRGGFHPAEVKFQSNPVQLVQVESSIRLSSDCYTHLYGNTPQGLLKGIQATVVDTVEEVFSRPLLKVSGRFVDEGDPILPKTRKNELSVPDGGIKLDILTRHPLHSEEGVNLLTRARRVGLTGCLSLTAYLHSRATYSDALQAIKEDACRSLTSQLVALTEADTVHDTSTGLSLSLPCRVSVTVPSAAWSFSEYSLPGEDVKECEGRVCDLLGVASATALLSSLCLESSSSSACPQDTPQLDSVKPNQLESRSISSQLWMFIAAVMVLIFAIAIWAVVYS